MKDPARLSEGSDALGELMRAARADVPTASELSEVASAIANLPPAAPGAGAATGGGAAAAAGAAGVSGGKVVGVLVIACALVAASIYGLIKTQRPLLAPAVPIVSQPLPPLPPERTAPVPSVPPAESALPTAEPGTATSPSAPSGRSPRPAQTESQLLDAARAAVQTDPSRALALTRRHAQLFPNGVLVQEREVIAIEALKRQGKGSAAQGRAQTFERNYPNSPHKPKLDELRKTP
jgi:hypothetical protein